MKTLTVILISLLFTGCFMSPSRMLATHTLYPTRYIHNTKYIWIADQWFRCSDMCKMTFDNYWQDKQIKKECGCD